SQLFKACLILAGLSVTSTLNASFNAGSPIVAAVSLEQAAHLVQGSAGGRILGAETRNAGGRTVYIIKVLTPDGKRVRYIQVDAESGRIIGGG
ncbi:MAG: PepSY domain-containing protein, partial [Methylococcales bacterium]